MRRNTYLAISNTFLLDCSCGILCSLCLTFVCLSLCFHRWDKPRIPGERRRRIIREKDLPEAPPEPPPSGYVVFVGQMTTKIRHDRPNVQHDQSKGTFRCSVLSSLKLLCLFFSFAYKTVAGYDCIVGSTTTSPKKQKITKSRQGD